MSFNHEELFFSLQQNKKSDKKNHIDFIVFTYMSLSIGLRLSPQIFSWLVERWHYKVKTLSKLIENLQVQFKHDYEAEITGSKTFKDDISFLPIR